MSLFATVVAESTAEAVGIPGQHINSLIRGRAMSHRPGEGHIGCSIVCRRQWFHVPYMRDTERTQPAASLPPQ